MTKKLKNKMSKSNKPRSGKIVAYPKEAQKVEQKRPYVGVTVKPQLKVSPKASLEKNLGRNMLTTPQKSRQISIVRPQKPVQPWVKPVKPVVAPLKILKPNYTGVKRALMIGINYFGTNCELNGCHNDVDNMRKVLIDKFNYDPNNIVTLKDSKDDTNFESPSAPTRDNILKHMNDLVKQTKKDDVLFIHYSGHGSWEYSTNGAEIDGKDECICPIDNTQIMDNELENILVDNFPEGARLTCILDCCHSGSSMDLPLRWEYGLKLMTENPDKNNIKKDIKMIGGCKDDQTSADANIANLWCGALTWAILESLNEVVAKNLQFVTWKDFVGTIRYKLKVSKYEQVPQLGFCNASQLDMMVDF